MRYLPALMGVLLTTSGCATIFEGTSQSVSVTTDPAGANCTVDRKGTRVGQVNPTPGSIHIDKSKDDLSIHCEHVGYTPSDVADSPRFQGTTFGNIVAGGLIGVVVDAASGANYEYPSDLRITMAPQQPPVAGTTTPFSPIATTR